MQLSPVRRFAVLLLILFFLPAAAEAQKKKKPTPKKKARKTAPAPKPETASGNTLEERLASLVNGKTASSSDASIQIVEVETGRVVAQRNPNTALAPASNMKLFTTGAAADLLRPDFEVKTSVYIRGDVDPSGTLN